MRASLIAPVAGLALVAGPVFLAPDATTEPASASPAASVSVAPESSGLEWYGSDTWRTELPKVDAREFIRGNGGLWSTEVPYEASGELSTVPGTTEAPHEAEREVSIEILVEDGLGVDGLVFADQVMDILNDPRGWGHDGSVVFSRTDSDADRRLYLASPATTDELCAPVPTNGRVSCGRAEFAVLNAQRWAEGADPFTDAGGTVEEYREYLVNHEMGHTIGFGHVGCPAPGEPAPVMLQQSLWLDGCEPNGWPNPEE